MSIKKKLKNVMNTINDFSKQTNMVAINAAIYASRLSNSEGAPFQVLAREIQNMSTQSMDKLGELDNLMNYITNLSTLINLVGSQRMLLMKMLVGNSLKDRSVLDQSIDLFEYNLNQIESSDLNTIETSKIINSIKTCWPSIKSVIKESNIETSFDKANQLISMINTLLLRYEGLAR